GVPPMELEDDAQTGEIAWRMHAPTVSSELAEIIDRMVCYDFRYRYQTAVEALDALQSLSTQTIETDFDLPEEAITLLSPLPLLSTESEKVTSEMDLASIKMFAPTASQDETLTLDGSGISAEPLDQFQASQATNLAQSTLLKRLIQTPSISLVPALAGLAVVGLALLYAKSDILLQPIQKATAPFSSTVRRLTGTSNSPAASLTPASNQASSLVEQASQLRKQGHYQEALAAYDQLIKLNPKMALAYWGRCDSLVSLGRSAIAIVACNDALALKPDYPEALWSKGKAFRQQKRIIEALGLFEEATLLKPDFTDAWVDRGMALQEVGRSAEAIDALDQAISLNRNSAAAWSTKGAALWNLGRFDAAINSLDKALQIQPNAPGASALRQQAREQLGY
ncbi:MAG: tetratricopeptide repeat protein, partial [Kovacikia sp.]